MEVEVDRRTETRGRDYEFLSKQEVSKALERFDGAIRCLGYKPVIAGRIHRTFHALIKRNGLLRSEAEMVKGISRRISERVTGGKAERPRG